MTAPKEVKTYYYSEQQKEICEELGKLTTMRLFPYNEMRAFLNKEDEFKNNYGGEELIFVNAIALHKMKSDHDSQVQALKADLLALVKKYSNVNNHNVGDNVQDFAKQIGDKNGIKYE